jgi:hypothetical protein
MTALIEIYGTDHLAVVHWICQEYGIGVSSTTSQFMNPHRMRRESIAKRVKLYRDDVHGPASEVVDKIYKTPKMREIMRDYICVAAGQNVSRRIVNEVASLYDRPALRTLTSRNEEFHAEEKRLQLHFVQQEAHRLTNLCNETLLWQFRGVDGKTAIRIITPDLFDAIPDPRDGLVPAAYVLDSAPISMLVDKGHLPHWEVWDDTYVYRINQRGRLVNAQGDIVVEPEAHGLGRIPGVLLHRRQPTTCILDASYGEDIKSTHLAVVLLDMMIMRLSKAQGENQPILRGNLAGMAQGQVMSGEEPIVLPPEVIAEMLNMKTDPDHYLAVKRDKITSVAQTYGMSYEQFTNSESGETASGKAYQVRREKLTELRMEQRGRAVIHEIEVIELMGFDATSASIDFQEQAIPSDAVEEMDLLDKRMRKGLDSPVSYVMRKDPDKTRDQAKQFILDNLSDFAMLILAVRALNIPANADAANPGASPEQNGAMGGRPPANDAEPAEQPAPAA